MQTLSYNHLAYNFQYANQTTSMKALQLMKLFVDELKDMYWTERALTRAMPMLLKNATSEELADVLESHLGETEGHVQRLEQVFDLLDKKPSSKKCDAMANLLKEAENVIDNCDTGAMCDAAIMAVVQKIEHYEIASYKTLRTFASTLGLAEVVDLLQLTLEEEKETDEKLTEIAQSAVNIIFYEEEEEQYGKQTRDDE